jgi:hypothetical protein
MSKLGQRLRPCLAGNGFTKDFFGLKVCLTNTSKPILTLKKWIFAKYDFVEINK